MDYAKDDVQAHKAWFFFDQGFVCLGAGIAAQKDESVTTSLNQTLLNGDVLLMQSQQVAMGKGQVVGKDVRGVFHDGVGYYFLGEQQTIVRADAQTGTWTSIEEDSSRKDPVTKDVFGLWVDHGVRPVNGSYAYAVMPGVDLGTFTSLSKKLPFHVISNSVDIQAVAFPDEGIVQAAFFQAGSVQVLDGLSLRVDAPCLVILQQQSDKWTVSVSDPTQRLDQVHVTLGGSFEGEGAMPEGASTVVTIDFPQDQWSGKTVMGSLIRK
jgi:chondroitin AC lyase